MTRQYGDNGFIPTVENVTKEGSERVLETIDARDETDLISTDRDGLVRRGDRLTEKQEGISELRR